ncbi:MAG: hypothetical protein MUC35_03895 [Candidatus Margulisbacteria bacterium]|jgi:hypothetical protein|nr:hypothetical protein [Candidatus Margulisiibacteriota bacterium]
MKKSLTIIALLLGIATLAAAAGFTFLPVYSVVGQVVDAPAAPAAGRTVVFFKEMNERSEVTVYTLATVGSDGRYLVNATSNFDLPLTVGETYKVAVVRDASGYGAGPVSVTISGSGYDAAPAMTMAYGAGVIAIGPGITDIRQELPPVVKLSFGSRLYQPALVTDEKPFIISERPSVKADVTVDSPYALAMDPSKLTLVIDSGSASQQILEMQADNIAKKVLAAGSTAAEERISALSLAYNLAEALTEGKHHFTVNARSSGAMGAAGITAYVATVEVMGGPVRLIGVPICSPSPYSITKNRIVTIQYTLSKDADIQLVFLDISGQTILSRTYLKGTEGGSAGVNKVTWDGQTDRGYKAGNGIYLGTVVSKEDNRKLGTVKLTVFD